MSRLEIFKGDSRDYGIAWNYGKNNCRLFINKTCKCQVGNILREGFLQLNRSVYHRFKTTYSHSTVGEP